MTRIHFARIHFVFVFTNFIKKKKKNWYSQTSLCGHSLNTDTLLLWIICFVLGERESLHFLSPLNRDTFYSPLSVHINRVWLYHTCKPLFANLHTLFKATGSKGHQRHIPIQAVSKALWMRVARTSPPHFSPFPLPPLPSCALLRVAPPILVLL